MCLWEFQDPKEGALGSEVACRGVDGDVPEANRMHFFVCHLGLSDAGGLSIYT